MKQIQKRFALFCAVLMIMAVMPMAFAAQSDVIATGTGGEGITWTLTEGGVLTVSGNGPIVDEVKVEVDEDGNESSEMIDCIGWQLDRVWEERTKDMDAAEAARARFDLVKKLVIEEGITEIPYDEFSELYPRSITLPSTLTRLGYSAVNASFAETLTVNSKELVVTGGVVAAGHRKDIAGYASIDEAIAAKITHEAQMAEMEKKMYAVYDLGAAYALQNGIEDELTEEMFFADFNTLHGTDFTDLEACIAYCIERINADFGTRYTKAEDVYTIVPGEDGSYTERNAQLDTIITEMYESADIEPALSRVYLGEEGEEDVIAYAWTTVCAPSGSGAEEAAAISGVSFKATTEPEKPDNSFLGRVKRFFGKIKTLVMRLINWIKFGLAILKK